ncbi:MAG: YidB family protein [Alphaproteobacteria bacterium]
MTALLGLLAVAGYQNRHKIAKFLGSVGQPHSAPGGNPWRDQGRGQAGGLTGMLQQLAQNLARDFGGQGSDRTTPGGSTGGSPPRLTDRSGWSRPVDAAAPWAGTGPDRPVTSAQIEQAIGPEMLDALSRQTGLSRQEIIARLSREHSAPLG